MVSPQKENGYTAIANEIMEALSKTRIAGEARQVLDFILRKTYGFNKKEDSISLSQFYLGTGLGKTHIIRALHYLGNINIIHITKKGNRSINKYRFNKDFTTWQAITKKGNVTNNGNDVTNNGNNLLPKKGHTKVDYTKVDIIREPSALQAVIDFFFSIKDYNKDKEWVKQNYARHCPAAKRLLKLGGLGKVQIMITKGREYFEDKKLDWKLETIEKHWNEIKRYKMQGKEWI